MTPEEAIRKTMHLLRCGRISPATANKDVIRMVLQEQAPSGGGGER